MTTYRDAGFLAAAFRNFLALLGWSAGEEQEIYTLDELIEKFSLDRIHQSNATFNFDPNNPKRWTDDKGDLDERRIYPHRAARRIAAICQNRNEIRQNSGAKNMKKTIKNGLKNR